MLRTEPQLIAVWKPCGDALGDEPRAALTVGDGGSFGEEGARIEDLEDFRLWPADGGDHRRAGSDEQLGQLAASIAV